MHCRLGVCSMLNSSKETLHDCLEELQDEEMLEELKMESKVVQDEFEEFEQEELMAFCLELDELV